MPLFCFQGDVRNKSVHKTCIYKACLRERKRDRQTDIMQHAEVGVKTEVMEILVNHPSVAKV